MSCGYGFLAFGRAFWSFGLNLFVPAIHTVIFENSKSVICALLRLPIPAPSMSRCIITTGLRLNAQDKETSLCRKYLNVLIHIRTATFDTGYSARERASYCCTDIPSIGLSTSDDMTIKPQIVSRQKVAAPDTGPFFVKVKL
jgi:hypothetical protein